jgi:hypothetical protein
MGRERRLTTAAAAGRASAAATGEAACPRYNPATHAAGGRTVPTSPGKGPGNARKGHP